MNWHKNVNMPNSRLKGLLPLDNRKLLQWVFYLASLSAHELHRFYLILTRAWRYHGFGLKTDTETIPFYTRFSIPIPIPTSLNFFSSGTNTYSAFISVKDQWRSCNKDLKLSKKKSLKDIYIYFDLKKNIIIIFPQIMIFFNNTISILSSSVFFSKIWYLNDWKRFLLQFFSNKKIFLSANRT